MRVVAGGRGTGRTLALVRWVKEGRTSGLHRVIVCHSHAESRRLARAHGLTLNEVSGPDGDMRERGALVEVAVDNADMLLRQRYGNVKVVAVEDPELWYTLPRREGE